MKVDFHVHSTASDGSETPSALASSLVGFSAAAITDHDNCDGVDEFLSAPSFQGCRRISGIELSIDPGNGFDKFHLVALGIDRNDGRLKKLLQRVLEGRNARNRCIAENFARIGIEINQEDLKTYANGEVLARPHFARYLADRGYASDMTQAFERYLLPDSPPEHRCYEERWHPPQNEVFDIVHAAGGICVMAHPKYWRARWRREGCDFAAAERELWRLKECGLDALECLYQANLPEENVRFSMIADRVGLLKSAGSDFHGKNKPQIKLGMDVSERFIAPLLEAVS